MEIKVQNSQTVCVMDAAIVSECIRQMIADIKVNELLGGMSACSAVTVDLSAVEKVDAAGLLFLISLQKTYEAQDKTLTFTGCGDSLREICTAMGLSDLLRMESQGGDSHEHA